MPDAHTSDGVVPLSPPSAVSAYETSHLLPFREALLAFNDAPYRRHSQEIQDTVKEYDEIIARIATHAGTLESMHHRLKADRDGIQGLLSPLRRFPNEILLRIFQVAISAPLAQAWGLRRPEPKRVTYVLSRVCVRWKDILYNVPELWNTIAFTIREGTDTAIAKQFLLSRLLRSGALPVNLTVVMKGSPQDHPATEPLPLEAVKSLGITVDVKLMSALRLSRLFGTEQPSMPSLEHLDFFRSQKPDEGKTGAKLLLDIRPHAPRLVSLKLRGSIPRGFQLPFHQLTKIDTTASLDFIGLADMVSQCKALHTLNVEWMKPVSEVPIRVENSPPQTPVTLPNLRSIHVKCNTTLSRWEDRSYIPDSEHLLEFLTLPALQTFEFHKTDLPIPEIMNSFAARSFLTLTSLTISDIVFDQGWDGILAFCDNLKSLYLSGTGIDVAHLFTALLSSALQLESITIGRKRLDVEEIEDMTLFIEQKGWLLGGSERKLHSLSMLILDLDHEYLSTPKPDADRDIPDDLLNRLLSCENLGFHLKFWQWYVSLRN